VVQIDPERVEAVIRMLGTYRAQPDHDPGVDQHDATLEGVGHEAARVVGGRPLQGDVEAPGSPCRRPVTAPRR